MGAAFRSKPNAECVQCGKHFHANPARIARSDRVFGLCCSTACHVAFRMAINWSPKDARDRNKEVTK